MTAALLLLLLLAGERQVEAGLEDHASFTRETTINRSNVLGLDRHENTLRGTVGWKETRGRARLVLRGFGERTFGSRAESRLVAREAWGQWTFSDGLSLRGGKQRVAWGSGFAWNPTNRLEPAKSPLNPGLPREGSIGLRADWIPTAWAGVIAVVVRRGEDRGELSVVPARGARGTAGAVRVRFLVADTDLALIVSAGDRTLLGIDVGRTLGATALHAEAAAYRGAELAPAREARTFLRLATGALHTIGQTTLSLEYFHNGEGYRDAERDGWLAGLDASFQRAGDPEAPPQVRQAARESYALGAVLPYSGGLGLRRNYLHAAVTRSIGGGRWTAAARAVAGLDDGGVAFTPGLTWAPRGDLTLAVDAVLLGGPADSEYGLLPVGQALQARLQVLF